MQSPCLKKRERGFSSLNCANQMQAALQAIDVGVAGQTAQQHLPRDVTARARYGTRMNVYFLGIAGAGVSALASVMHSQGHSVSGSDEGVFPPVSTYLDDLGIPYATSFDAANVPAHVDVAIVGTTAKMDPATNPELAELKRRGVPCHTFASYLGEHTKERENLIVAGSFGKSSLTALITFILIHAGQDPGWFIGAIPLDLPQTGHNGTDPLFIMEGDEYVVSLTDRRSKFELYTPAHTLISSIVHDHINMFPTMELYEAPFAKLIEATPKDGLLVVCHGFEPVRRLVGDRKAVWYGVDPNPGYFADNVVIGEFTTFALCLPNGEKVPMETELLGRHNIENIIGACAFLLERGLVTNAQLQSAIKTFRGVARRLDKKTRTSSVPIYEGFGSSYEKARSAIEAIELHFPARKSVVVFEPHTFSWRNQNALSWYDTVFEGVERVLIMAPPTHGATGHDQLTQAQIIARVAATGVQVLGVQDGAEVLASLPDSLGGDEVVLLLSSGPLDGLAASLPPVFDARFGLKK
jgi:UDP-N-acetylmuramate: L-alanyl-gamma-D-glutamyl-meso-diaminopimelate ligase